jgi:hypothetical protein
LGIGRSRDGNLLGTGVYSVEGSSDKRHKADNGSSWESHVAFRFKLETTNLLKPFWELNFFSNKAGNCLFLSTLIKDSFTVE